MRIASMKFDIPQIIVFIASWMVFALLAYTLFLS